MTLEEMRLAIKGKCKGTPCIQCPLHNNGDDFCADYTPGNAWSEARLRIHYGIMFGKTQEDEPINVRLTKAQIEQLIYLVDATLVKQIRDTDHRIDVDALHEITSAYMELRKAIKQ